LGAKRKFIELRPTEDQRPSFYKLEKTLVQVIGCLILIKE
jgi:hypothetical protein